MVDPTKHMSVRCGHSARLCRWRTLSLAGLNKPAALGIALWAASTVRRPPRPGLHTLHLSGLLLVVRNVNFPEKSVRRHSCWLVPFSGIERATPYIGCVLNIVPLHTVRAVVGKAILADPTRSGT